MLCSDIQLQICECMLTCDMLKGYGSIKGPCSPMAGQLRPQRYSVFRHVARRCLWSERHAKLRGAARGPRTALQARNGSGARRTRWRAW